MYKLGEFQLLTIVGKSQGGFFIKREDEENAVLLPFGEVIGDVEVYDEVMVFLYKDTKDRLVATMKTPLATVGELAVLKVKEIVEFGAFVEIGLQRDLFVPLKEMGMNLKKGKSYLFYIYIDKSERLCATPRVYDHLSTDHEYKANDQVTGTIIRINPEVGVFVAVDNKYVGMIPKNEYFENFEMGDTIDLRVIRVREDKKIDLATRKLVADQMSVDAEKIYSRLLSQGGKLYYHDKSSPEAIKAEFQMSKKAFKRALGRLMKNNKIEIYEDYIEKKDD
ncbi:S1 RNA-binding domain-containing protein [Acidaminobacter sp. JC074]|uniref:CvfB family protein n=1 Tax=Acidaminobacter sp. JC074 TaxID=2530199 RepID=UPI001F0F20BA|nr:S1-like domain-containing RNA-binding protein [Acidaminobacter sp. JC074]